MATRVKIKVGDIFSVEISENEFIYGKVLFEPKEQYIKKIPSEKQFSYLDFFQNCVLIETYIGVFTSFEKIDIKNIGIKGQFVSKKMFKRDDVEIIANQPVNPKDISFPEVISTYGSNYYFTVGELKLPIKITSKEYDEIHVYPSFGSGYWELVATLVWSGRMDLVEEERIKNNTVDVKSCFEASDLQYTPEKRNKIYSLVGEKINQSYYELALKHGFDLERLY